MALRNYWWLLIWLFTGGLLIYYLFPRQEEMVLGKKEVRWRIPAALLLCVPYWIWAGYRPDGFGDTGVYRESFLKAPTAFSALSNYLHGQKKDTGYYAFMAVFKIFFGNHPVWFFLLVAGIQMLCLVLVYRKYSSDYWISIFLFIASTDYMSWMHNGMRQFLAAACIFACLGLIAKKKYIPVILVILMMSTVHKSCLLMIPIIFVIQGKAWSKRTIFFSICVGIVIAYINQFTSILSDALTDTQYSNMMTNDIWQTDNGTSFLRILVYSVPAILSLFGKKYVDEANDTVINISVNASVCTMMLYLLSGVTSGIYIGRLPIYTSLMSYISLPWLIDHMFTEGSAKLIKFLMIAGYILMFYYQMHFAWNVI